MAAESWATITGVVLGSAAVASIVSGLFDLASRKADRDARTRERKEDADERRLNRLLDERRTAYAELLTAATDWLKLVKQSESQTPESDQQAMRRASAIAQVLAPERVAKLIRNLETELLFTENDYDRKRGGTTYQDKLANSARLLDNLVVAMRADLAGSSDQPRNPSGLNYSKRAR